MENWFFCLKSLIAHAGALWKVNMWYEVSQLFLSIVNNINTILRHAHPPERAGFLAVVGAGLRYMARSRQMNSKHGRHSGQKTEWEFHDVKKITLIRRQSVHCFKGNTLFHFYPVLFKLEGILISDKLGNVEIALKSDKWMRKFTAMPNLVIFKWSREKTHTPLSPCLFG